MMPMSKRSHGALLGVIATLLALLVAIGALLLVRAAPAAAQAPAWTWVVDSTMRAELARSRAPGGQVAVVIDGRLAYTRGYGYADAESRRGVSERTLFRVGTVTMMVTAATVAQLAAEGKLDLDAPISRYVTELEGKGVGRVTTHQLLTHTAGYVNNVVPNGRMGEGALGEVMRAVGDTLLIGAAGGAFNFSNPGYAMAGYVAERASGSRFGNLALQSVLSSVGMPRATFRPLEALTHDFSLGHTGRPGVDATVLRPYAENTAQMGAGYLITSVGELANLTIVLMDSGRIAARQPLARSAVARMTTGHVDVPGAEGVKYGYGLRISERWGERIWEHDGNFEGFRAQVVMFPDRRAAVLWVSNRSDADLSAVVSVFAQRVLGPTGVR
jgi:CubicO group peptidase (beta-lactamase class C family)